MQVIQTLGTEKARPAIAPQVITSFRSVGSLLYETKRKTTFPLQSFEGPGKLFLMVVFLDLLHTSTRSLGYISLRENLLKISFSARELGIHDLGVVYTVSELSRVKACIPEVLFAVKTVCKFLLEL